jgi:hypothetical protein
VKPLIKKAKRFRNMHAWANRILRIDLDNMDIEVQEAEP